MAAFSVAAFVLCFSLTGATNIASGFADKKAYNKGYKAIKKGDYPEAEKIFRDLLGKDAEFRSPEAKKYSRRVRSCRARAPD
jgi:outer membrane protein assembly factor BamD (BamD/ComL family)